MIAQSELNSDFYGGGGSASSLIRPFWPNVVYVSHEVADTPFAKRIRARLSGLAEFREVEGEVLPDDALRPARGRDGHLLPELSSAERFSLGKRVLWLKRFKGAWLKSCPGTTDHVCCNLWIVNPGEGCPFDCTYCYLQAYLLRSPTLKIYTNIDEMIAAIEERADAAPSRYFRICTGEVIDSLAFDTLTDSSLELVPFFARKENLSLELKTKSKEVANLVAMKDVHRGKTVVSWSVNAETISSNEEAFTAPVGERLLAAQAVVEAGYRVGFHFDPLIWFEGWEDQYRDLIARIADAIPLDRIAWVSISSLRFKADMRETMAERFPESPLPYQEQFLGTDNKLRYFQPLRFRMLSFVWNELKSRYSKLPVYMCMESADAWRAINGGPPVAGSELVEIFSRKGVRR